MNSQRGRGLGQCRETASYAALPCAWPPVRSNKVLLRTARPCATPCPGGRHRFEGLAMRTRQRCRSRSPGRVTTRGTSTSTSATGGSPTAPVSRCRRRPSGPRLAGVGPCPWTHLATWWGIRWIHRACRTHQSRPGTPAGDSNRWRALLLAVGAQGSRRRVGGASVLRAQRARGAARIRTGIEVRSSL